MRILIIAPGRARQQIAALLESVGFAVDSYVDKSGGARFLTEFDYDACVVSLEDNNKNDLQLETLEQLRDIRESTHILALLPKGSKGKSAEAFRSGADDVMICPPNEEELVERIRSLCRRKYAITTTEIQVDDMLVDCSRRRVSRNGETIELTPREFALLEYLAIRQGRVVSREDIREHVYDALDQVSSSNVVDVYIGYLRKKIEREDWPKMLHTRRGHGYILGLTDRDKNSD